MVIINHHYQIENIYICSCIPFGIQGKWGVKIRKRLIPLGIVITLVFFLLSSTALAVDISSCTNINSPGTYDLTTNIMDSSADCCINITSSNIVLDGQGHTIDGIDKVSSYGIYVYNPSISLTNVIIKNLVIRDWYYGIRYEDSNNGRLENTNVSSGSNGVYAYKFGNNTIANNNISYASMGLYITGSPGNNTVINNLISDNSYGINIFISQNNTFTNNTMRSNNIGIEIGSHYNTFTNNYIINNSYGILMGFMAAVNGNLFYNNYLNNTDNYMNAYGGGNYLNTSLQLGTNIIGGPYIGGNYWAEPDGTGYSETCTDSNQDGICNSPYYDTGDYDYWPLTRLLPGQVVDNCTVISQPGMYILINDIIDHNQNTCINITTSNVVFEGYKHTIDGIGAASTYGIYIHNPSTPLSNITIRNLVTTDWDNGIRLENTHNASMENVTALNNIIGINLLDSDENTLENNIVSSSSTRALLFSYSNSNILINNMISGNSDGIFLNYSANNSIYNNFFYNNNNVGIFPTNYKNYWNTTKGPGGNIMAGYYLGGNYWANLGGTGHSETCTDSDKDGICDNAYTLTSDNVDYLPLAKGAIGMCTEIGSPGYYYLTRDILNKSYCMKINSSDVIFDGLGHALEGKTTAYGYAVHVRNPSTTLTNVTVKNLVTRIWFYSIYYVSANDGIIENITASQSLGGISLSNSHNNKIINNNVSNNNNYGIYVSWSNNSFVSDNFATSNGNGVQVYRAYYNTIADNYLSLNSAGILFSSSAYNIAVNNTAIQNNYGISTSYSTFNTMYNNYLDNTNDFSVQAGYTNYWNTAQQLGTNIIGGPYIGGNYWAGGTGYSETCTDSDYNGLCDNAYTLNADNVDNLPLTTLGEGVITSCTEIDSSGEYYLGADILDSTDLSCIRITSSDVVLNGQGHVIDGRDFYNSIGISLIGSWNNTLVNVTIRNINISDWYRGVVFDTVNNSRISGAIITSNRQGIRFEEGGNISVYNSELKVNTDYGLYIRSYDSTNNLIYNNNLVNSRNVYVEWPSDNTWNIAKTVGTNIVGGINLGGNYWGNPAETGFSDTCSDNDNDDICDSTYALPSSTGDYDYFPLAYPLSISSCTEINVPGEHRLGADIKNSYEKYCINITTSNVVLEGKGHVIDGRDTGNTYGVFISNSPSILTNVTVRNLVVSDWDIGVFYYRTQNSKMENTYILSNPFEGTRLMDSSYVNVTGSVFFENYYGIELASASNLRIYDNYFSNYYSENVGMDGTITSNTWNTPYDCTSVSGLGWPCAGGNYWGHPDGTGFSDTCADANNDYICDSPYTRYVSPLNRDYYPLAKGPIGFCIEIQNPGDYFLPKHIRSPHISPCIHINSSNVVLNGQYHYLYGVDDTNSYGVHAYDWWDSTLTNVTVKNLNPRDWYRGIYFQNVKDSRIEDNYASYNNNAGIYLSQVNNTQIIDNTASVNQLWGIYLETQSYYNTIRNNVANSQNSGIRLMGNSDYNIVDDNTAGGNQYNVYLSNADHNTLSNNQLTYANYGIYLGGADSNNITGNTITDIGVYGTPSYSGIYLSSAQNNIIYNNFFDNYYNVYFGADT